MTIKASNRHFEDEREGDRELVLVAVTYTGAKSSYQDTAVRTQGHWPSYGAFNRGVPEVAFIPDSGLGYFESHADFDVDYDVAGIAEALLERNYLAPDVFQAGAGGGETKKRILNKLGIERLPRTEDGIRQELVELAELDDDPGGDDTRGLADELADPDDGFTRAELQEVVDDRREGPDEITLNSGKTDFAEFLADEVDGDGTTEKDIKDELRGVDS